MDNKEIKILNIDDVLPNRFQPRIKFDEKAINELAESIKVHGVIQPIVVRRISDKYEIIAGERRYKASVLAGKTTIPAIITSLDDRDSAEIALIENVQRQNLTPIEEAISYKKILDMGYLNQITLGEKLGKTQSTIANKLRLLNLEEDVQEALMSNQISERHARSLLRLDKDMQKVILNKIITERLTVRKTDEEIEKILKDSGNNENDDSEKVMEMSEIMDQNMFKDLNIPTEPIVEEPKIESDVPTLETIDFSLPSIEPDEIKPVEEIQSIQPQPIIEENNIENDILNSEINPGFMNVEKIESEAEDIYKEPVIADIDKLMDTSNNPQIEEPVIPMQEVPLTPSELEESPHNVPGGGKFFTMFAKEEDTNPDYVKDIESKEVNMNFGEPKIDSTFSFNPSQFIEPDEVKQENIIQPNQVFSMSQPVEQEMDQTMDFTQTLKPLSLNDENTFSTDTMSETKPIEPPVSMYPTPDPVTYDEMGEIKVKLPDQQKLATTDLKTVINTIRECAATIERFGFTIDTEEIDFENRYEVIFKIDKN